MIGLPGKGGAASPSSVARVPAGPPSATAERLLAQHPRGASGAVAVRDVAPEGSDAPRSPLGTLVLCVVHGQGVLHARGEELEIGVGGTAVLARGTAHRLETGADGLRAIAIATTHGAPVGDAPVVVPTEAVDAQVLHDPARGCFHMATRWLVSDEMRGSLVVGHATFEREDSAHLLHRHTEASEFFLVLEGRGVHTGAGGDVVLEPGDLVCVPDGEWHGFGNDGRSPVRALFGYWDVPNVGASGYEPHPAVVEAHGR